MIRNVWSEQPERSPKLTAANPAPKRRSLLRRDPPPMRPQSPWTSPSR